MEIYEFCQLGFNWRYDLKARKLEATNLKKSYRDRHAVKGISLEVSQGQVVGLLGPNGAGKTTAFYMIVGVQRPDEGSIHLDGQNITGFPMHKRAKSGLGYLSQERSIFRKLTVEENLIAVLEMLPLNPTEKQKRLDSLLSELGIQHVRKIKGYALSGGESRRAEIARALVLEPSFMLLDEPFAGVDPIAVADIQTIIQQLAKRNIGVLITDHNVRETFGIIDYGYIMNEGELLIDGTPDELVENDKARKVYLGKSFSM
ncbi:MAG: Lipopolysaccharide export system ATP-binding protein LptB [Deltaproteobacteria bacterium]|jgi:lipopolysaccharide export system ATP-binding protein|nr:Lipopolysaccharide export system ATP-binding protein LptB [Deltaproteobacteria bacterium]